MFIFTHLLKSLLKIENSNNINKTKENESVKFSNSEASLQLPSTFSSQIKQNGTFS